MPKTAVFCSLKQVGSPRSRLVLKGMAHMARRRKL